MYTHETGEKTRTKIELMSTRKRHIIKALLPKVKQFIYKTSTKHNKKSLYQVTAFKQRTSTKHNKNTQPRIIALKQ